MKRFILVLQNTILLAAAVDAQDSFSEKVFPEFYAAAESRLEDTESLSNAIYSEERAAEDLQLRKSYLLPSIGTYAQYHIQNEDFDPPLGDQDSERFLYGITMRQPLYHWGSLKASRQVGEILLKQAKRNTQMTRQVLKNELLRRGLEYYLVERDLAFAQVMLKHYAHVLNVAEESVKEGILTLADLENTRQHHRNATQNQIRSLTSKLRVHHQLLKDFSLPEDVLDTIPDEIPENETIDLMYWEQRVRTFIEHGFQEHPHFQNVMSNIDMQEKQIKALRSGNRPNVDLVVGANQDDTSYVLTQLDDRFRQIYYAGVRVNWNIFDGKATQSRINSAKTNLAQAKRQKDFAALQLAQEARRVLHEIQNADVRLKTLKMTMENREERHEKTRQSHEIGQVPESELANSAYDLAYHQHLYHVEYVRSLIHMLYAELITSLKGQN